MKATTYLEYEQFLRNKAMVVNETGFAVSDMHAGHFPHAKVAVEWAAKRGRGLLACSFGLGKTRMQIELAKQAFAQTGQPVLVICPLGVKHQFMHIDGPAMDVHFEYVRTDEEFTAAAINTPYLITNYERVRDGDISQASIDQIGAVCLDEAAILGNLGTKTADQFGILFSDTRYKWCATATPAPNDYRQLLYFAEFLGAMDSSQGLTRWFQRNPDKAGDLQLMPHMAEEFWLWVASWCLFVTLPSDLGFDDAGYDMPEKILIPHRVTSDHAKAFDLTDQFGQRYLFKDTAAGVQQAMKEKRDSLGDRIDETLKTVLQCIEDSTFYKEGQHENATGTEQGILREKQGTGAGTGLALLPRKQGKNRQGKAKGVPEGVQENLQEEGIDAGTTGRIEPEEAGTVRNRPGIPGKNQEDGERLFFQKSDNAEGAASEVELRDNPRGIRQDASSSGWEVCDLRSDGVRLNETQSGASSSIRGSQSADGKSSGATLSPLQRRDWSLSGHPGFATESGGVSHEQFVIWCHLNDEQRALEKGFKQHGITVSSVYGSLSPEEVEERLFCWLNKETQVLIGKPQMMGSGVNLQQCHIAIYTGLDFKFRDFVQSVHRLHRFGQKFPVQIHFIHTDAEDHVVSVLFDKWAAHDEMVQNMRSIVKEYGLTNEALASEMRRSIGVDRSQTKGTWYTLTNNDCVMELMGMPDNSIDEIVTSIPFGNHYEYVASLNDFGHNPTDGDFWKQMDFLIPHLLRVLKPGRMACIHTKDRLLYGHQTPHGMMEVDYFTHDTARAFKKHGFVSYGEIFIPTDVVRENNSTNRLGWSENCKDGTKMGVGLSEKVLLFRKPQTDKSRSYADEPVKKDKKNYSRGRWQIDAHSLWRSNGQTLELPQDNPELLRDMDGSQVFNWHREYSATSPYDYEKHVAFNEAMGNRLPARFMLMPPQSPEEYEDTVWTDVLFMNTLNMSQAKRRVEKHVCPFPIDIVKRLINRFSNENDVILDPFSGLGTTVVTAVKMGRSGIGVELNPIYFDASLRYAYEAETKRKSPSLFDVVDDPVIAQIETWEITDVEMVEA